ncbi:hypothetical protein ACQKD8_22295 [Pseudomonas sp. NPDC077405]|jgi:hypothetical protein
MNTTRKALGVIALLFLLGIVFAMCKMTLDWLLATPDCESCVAESYWLMAGGFVGLAWAVMLWVGYQVFGKKLREQKPQHHD